MVKVKCLNNNFNIKCLKYGDCNNYYNIRTYNSNNFYVKNKISAFNLYISSNKKGINRNPKNKFIYRASNLKVFGFTNVYISSIGTIHSECWNISTNGGCKCSYIPRLLINEKKNNVYDKVISISHNWCNAVFHSIVECLVKLGYYIPELLFDTSIKIHLIRSAAIKYLHFLGFNSSRIIYGIQYIKRLLVLEKGSCGSSPPLIHLYSMRYYIRNKIKSKKIYDILIIKRYGIRDIINCDELYMAINTIYNKMKIITFYPNTSFSNTLNYFKYARIIVAPHGAGLSNIIIASNCIIIEFLKNNLCYSSLAKNLGLDYYGIYEEIINGKFFINITAFYTVLKLVNNLIA